MSDETTSAPVSEAPVTDAPETAPVEGKEPVEKDAAPKAAERKMRKVKVNGKEEEVDEEKVFADFQKYRAAEEKLQEAAMSRKQVAEFMRALQEDPEKVLSNPKLMNDDQKYAIAEKWMKARLERELMDPKDLEIQELKSYKEQRETQEKEATEAREAEEYQAQIVETKSRIESTLVEAMEKTVLAKDEATLRSMAYYMRACEERGIEVTPEDLIQHVEGRLMDNYTKLAKSRNPADLIKVLGEDVVNAIRKHDLDQIRAQRQPKEAAPPVNKPREAREPQVFDRFDAAAMARKKLGI